MDNSMPESFDDLYDEVMRNFHARTAARENDLRRKLANALLARLAKTDILPEKFVEALTASWADRDGISEDHARRVLHYEVGGDLPLLAIVRACDKLGFDVDITLTRRTKKG